MPSESSGWRSGSIEFAVPGRRQRKAAPARPTAAQLEAQVKALTAELEALRGVLAEAEAVLARASLTDRRR